MRINKLLLDTHVFLWWRSNDPLLQGAAKSAIADADVVFVSAATAWEAEYCYCCLRADDSQQSNSQQSEGS